MAFHNEAAFWLFAVIPVLVLAGGLFVFLSRHDRRRFADPALFDTLSASLSRTRRNIGTTAFFAGMFFLVLAMTEPRFGTKTEVVRRTGIDIVVALDTSNSMLAEDVKPNRLAQAKYEIGRIIDRLEGDRIALAVFAGRTVIQCPLTGDYAAAKNMLEFVEAGAVPVPGTNIEEAITASLDLLNRGSKTGRGSRLVILVTDGESLSGDPERAAKKAGAEGVHVITVGIGTPGGELIPMRDETGRLAGYQEDKNGEIVKTKLDERTLREVASLSGGVFLWEPNGEVNMDAVLEQVGSLKKADLSERRISRLRDRYQIPLGVSLFFLLVWLAAGERRIAGKHNSEGGVRP